MVNCFSTSELGAACSAERIAQRKTLLWVAERVCCRRQTIHFGRAVGKALNFLGQLGLGKRQSYPFAVCLGSSQKLSRTKREISLARRFEVLQNHLQIRLRLIQMTTHRQFHSVNIVSAE